jgi:hypothetical protein
LAFARATVDFSVPSGSDSSSAASAWVQPCPPHSTSAARSLSLSRASISSTSSLSGEWLAGSSAASSPRSLRSRSSRQRQAIRVSQVE